MSKEAMSESEQAGFTLAEVTRITGLNGETIRAWRKRGQLPSLPKYAKTSVKELASLAVTKLLLDHGMSLANARAEGDRYASYVLYLAALSTPGSVEVHGTAGSIAKFKSEWGESGKLAHELAETGNTVVVVITSADGGALRAGVKLEDDPDSLSGYYINLEGVGRHLGANAQKPLFTVRLAREEGDDGRVLVRRVPDIKPVDGRW